jgi:hypothetical protein
MPYFKLIIPLLNNQLFLQKVLLIFFSHYSFSSWDAVYNRGWVRAPSPFFGVFPPNSFALFCSVAVAPGKKANAPGLRPAGTGTRAYARRARVAFFPRVR